MTQTQPAPATRRRPPLPVLAAVGLHAALSALALALGGTLVTATIATAGLLLAFGLWQRNRGAYYLTLLLAATNVISTVATGGTDPAMWMRFLAGLLTGGLLLTPTARAWYHRR